MADYLKLVLMRHGESLGNIDGRLEGQMSTSLSPYGQQQARQLGQYLQTQSPPTHLYSSSLQRAIETAEILASISGLTPRFTPLLQELHQGIFQGLTWQEAKEHHPELCHQLTTTLRYQPVPEAETLETAHYRAIDCYQRLWHSHRPGDVLWIVSHGGFMQQLVGVILGCDRTWKIPIRNTAIFEFWLTGPRANNSQRHNPELWKMVRFNETPHLLH